MVRLVIWDVIAPIMTSLTLDSHGCGNHVLDPGRCGGDFKSIIFKLISTLDTRCEIAITWMQRKLTNEKYTLVW